MCPLRSSRAEGRACPGKELKADSRQLTAQLILLLLRLTKQLEDKSLYRLSHDGCVLLGGFGLGQSAGFVEFALVGQSEFNKSGVE